MADAASEVPLESRETESLIDALADSRPTHRLHEREFDFDSQMDLERAFGTISAVPRTDQHLLRIQLTGSGDGLAFVDWTGAGAPVCVTHLSACEVVWSAPPGYGFARSPDGGLLISSARTDAPQYWLPLAPRYVERDGHGRLIRADRAEIAQLIAEDGRIHVKIAAGTAPVETVVWQLPANCKPSAPSPLERSAWYMLGSHTLLRGRADVYRYLVAGTVFETRFAWPHRWRVFSENDAHALHLTLCGLAHAARDPLLQAIRKQVLLAVLDRQAADGGFHHGEWTELMESHYRVHCSAMHLMMDALGEGDPAVERALRAAAGFMAQQSVQLSFGRWLLHDELEHSVDKLKLGPFKWVPSTVFGKAESNMLVLNSHLDATIALDRYAQVTGDRQFEPLVRSARDATTALLSLRSAQPLYRLLFWLIGLTFLSSDRAHALPAWKRALKRLTWQFLIPRLPDIKARFPRLVMPGGYIDRELTLRTWAHDYHAINLMDLARYLRRFDDPVVREVLRQGLAFTHTSGILRRWRELDYQRYALGFWAEALYHACTLFPDREYRVWLAEAMLDLEDLQMGLPPSLLGANAEAVPSASQLPCPIPADSRLRVANIGRREAPELVVVNASREPLAIAWESPPPAGLRWQRANGSELVRESSLGPKSWAWARLGN